MTNIHLTYRISLQNGEHAVIVMFLLGYCKHTGKHFIIAISTMTIISLLIIVNGVTVLKDCKNKPDKDQCDS